ncbi:hypothetical protein G7046_g2046 [Stylonectria norvegica]|nr:hypothetical protein G7046_g2046 [Stylonectria norvegica]
MAPSRTSTIKNKHAAAKSGIKNSKSSMRSPTDGIVKSRKQKGTPPSTKKNDKARNALLGKKKRKTYSAEVLGIPDLNMITPVGVVKPKGQKKGKVFVDDRESMTTILSMVQAEKSGQIESKMIKARQMEEIREARKVEADAKEFERKYKIEDVKDTLRKKRKRHNSGEEETDIKEIAAHKGKSASSKSGPKKRVSFA